MAKDIFHQAVRVALENDGWKITHDPYPIRLLGLDLDIDLGAERVLAAEREEAGKIEKIAVEVKSFLSVSFMKDFHLAVGQYTNYKVLLGEREQERKLFLAIPKAVYERRFGVPGVRLIRQRAAISILVFDEETFTIERWES